MAAKEAKLVTFAWEGKDKSGNKSKGKIESESIAFAKAQLRKQGIIPSKVTKQRASMFSSSGKKTTPLDIAVFTRQLATMMKAGVPMVQAFDIVAGGVEKDSLKKMIIDIKNDVSSGSNLAASLRKFPIFFDDLFCNLVHAGEQSGALETMLDRIATYKEKTEELKAKIKKAMTYPIAVIIVGIIVSAILLIKVVPQFESIFKGFGADLPAFTKFVITLSEYAQAYWFIALGVIVASGFLIRATHRKSEGFRDGVDKFSLKLPVIGQILHKAAIARFARTLATTFAAGVPLVNALESAAGASGNVIYRTAILQVKNGVSTGQSLQNATRMTGVFPNMAVQMIAIGEEAGSLDEMLDKVASFYENEVDNAVDSLTSLMEPFIMAVLGVLVGGLVIAMYLPIFKLGAVV
ncbi:type II secretion system F family protein [Motiliproteus coralliicola]|uniref:Type II secretion system F family protein n=1 Tax=Motiliproteus coralliicola TaxID=2283196 RepID=A0A369WTI0_9GAMM|nr:type II secretion system F family protein [Motiliproteus coralliicola]RDE22805.1 type II secretion system F family protein [Motiliproteus coralliicola]